MKRNMDIRNYILSKGIYLYEVADAMNVSISTFTIKMRKELSEQEKDNIRKLVDEIVENRK